ncbi:hypothetical protein SDC9_196543 [bioreactor metagenome]|uniref:Uncharacterized protein n=1 Tax=bioreactor metagenome TaxID=1076179 RepID=A0A645ICS4_9ZZZZ
MGGRLVDLQRVGQPAVIVARVGHSPDDGDGHLRYARRPIQRVHRADEAGGVAGGQFQEVGTDALFVVGVAVEEHVRDAVLLAALEHGFLIVLLIDFLVLRADAARRAVEHDVDFLHQLLEAARHRDARFLHRVVFRRDVEHPVRHALFLERPHRQRWRYVRHAHKLHVALARHAVRQPLTYHAVSRDAYLHL